MIIARVHDCIMNEWTDERDKYVSRHRQSYVNEKRRQRLASGRMLRNFDFKNGVIYDGDWVQLSREMSESKVAGSLKAEGRINVLTCHAKMSVDKKIRYRRETG